MTQHHFQELLRQMCAHLHLAETAPLLETGLLRVGGYDLLLHFDEASDPDAIQARLDLGPVPAEQEEWLWHRLLVSNFEWGRGGLLGFSLTPMDNRVVLTVQWVFDEQTSGADAAVCLRRIVTCATAYWSALATHRQVIDIRSLLPLRQAAGRLSASASAAGPARWEQLIDNLCSHVGIVERDQLLLGGALEVDGVNMLLRYDAHAPDRFEVRIDLGFDYDMRREKLWQGLLWNNFLLGLGGRTLFLVHPEHDRVVLALKHDLCSDASASELAELLQATAASANTFWEQLRREIYAAESFARINPVS